MTPQAYTLPRDLYEDLLQYVQKNRGINDPETDELLARLEIHAKGPYDIHLDQAIQVLTWTNDPTQEDADDA